MSINHKLGVTVIASILDAHAEDVCRGGLTLGELGGGMSSVHALAKENSPVRSVVVVLCGPIPDDLVQALGQYCEALTQDLKTSGKLKVV